MRASEFITEGSSESVSLRDMVDVVDRHYPKYYAELSGSDISDKQFERAIVNAYKKIMQKQGVAEGLSENAEDLSIGDPVIITGKGIEFEGTTGEISDFGQNKRFVVVDLYNHGRYSFHSSDVSFNEYAGSDDEEARMYDAGEFGDDPRDEMNEQGVAENFADGRNPQDKGDAKRHGINTKASVSSLRKTAKQGGRKGQLAHWLANMKSGRAKAKKK